MRQQQAAINAAAAATATVIQPAKDGKWNYGVIALKPHHPQKFPILWMGDRIKVMNTQWDHPKVVEIAYDIPYQTLH